MGWIHDLTKHVNESDIKCPCCKTTNNWEYEDMKYNEELDIHDFIYKCDLCFNRINLKDYKLK